MKSLTITIKLNVIVDDVEDTSEAVGYVLDSGAIQEAIIEYGADHGFLIEITQSQHVVTQGHEGTNT